MQINFQYEEGKGAFDHMLKATSADGLEIEIGFIGLDADQLYFSGHELAVNSDDYKGLYVNFGHGLNLNIVPMASVIQQANALIEDIVREGNAERAAVERHYAGLASAGWRQ